MGAELASGLTTKALELSSTSALSLSSLLPSVLVLCSGIHFVVAVWLVATPGKMKTHFFPNFFKRVLGLSLKIYY